MTSKAPNGIPVLGAPSHRKASRTLIRSTKTSVGGYDFPQVGEGTYTVMPTKAGCTFTPSHRAVIITGQPGRATFKATCQ